MFIQINEVGNGKIVDKSDTGPYYGSQIKSVEL